MNIIPVIDLLDGQVVHAVRGEREKYRPVMSVLAAGSDPMDIANALIAETGCSEIYIADLNAILKKGSNRDTIARIGDKTGISLLVDAASFDAESAVAAKNSGADTVILGSETFADLEEFSAIIKLIPPDELLFSIDISGGRVLSRSDELRGIDPVDAIHVLSEKGIHRFILLTLDMVGSGEGPDIEIIKSARMEFPRHTLISGGGVKYASHLEQLIKAGADGVLIASSLHKGWLSAKDIKDTIDIRLYENPTE